MTTLLIHRARCIAVLDDANTELHHASLLIRDGRIDRIFKSDEPAPRARAIVEATAHFRDAAVLARVSRGLGAPMTGIGMDAVNQRFAERGW